MRSSEQKQATVGSIRSALMIAAGVLVSVVVVGSLGLVEFTANERRSQETADQLRVFGWALTMWAGRRGSIPDASIEEVVGRMRQERPFREWLDDYDIVTHNRDPWGRGLVLRVTADGLRAVVYSLGPNGRDDGGEGDDIRRDVNVRWRSGQK